MLDFIIGDALPWIIGLLGFFASVGIAYFKGGKAKEAKQTEARLKGMKEAQKVAKEIDDADRDTIVDINTK